MSPLLSRIDAAPFHALPVSSVDALDRAALSLLSESGYVRLMPASRRFPERYVVTGSGSHAMGTFSMDADLWLEVRRLRTAADPAKPAKPAKPAEAPKRRTYAQARADLLGGLEALGWQVSSALKVPHARSPEGSIALFFLPQAIHCAPLDGNASAASVRARAHSLFVDPRTLDASTLVRVSHHRCERIREDEAAMVARDFESKARAALR